MLSIVRRMTFRGVALGVSAETLGAGVAVADTDAGATLVS
jgi:hypothetical protein